MDTNRSLGRAVITFMGLAVAGASLIVSAQHVETALEQTILIAIGSAVFGAALAFFLVRLFALLEN